MEKTIERGVITETHKGNNKRVTGKRKPNEAVTLTAAEVKGLGIDTEEKFQKALAEEKETLKRQVQYMNTQANNHSATLETAHKAVVKKMTAKLNTIANKLAGEKHDSKANVAAWTKMKTERDKAKAELQVLATEKRENKEKRDAEKEKERREKSAAREKRKRDKSAARSQARSQARDNSVTRDISRARSETRDKSMARSSTG